MLEIESRHAFTCRITRHTGNNRNAAAERLSDRHGGDQTAATRRMGLACAGTGTADAGCMVARRDMGRGMMGERAREICERAYAVLDECAEVKADLAVRQARTLAGEDSPQWQSSAPPKQTKLQLEPKAKPQMDWNEWFEKGFRNFAALERKWVFDQLESLAGFIGAEMGKEETKLYAEIKALKAEVAVLRADLEIIRQHKADKELAGIVSLRSRAS